MSLNQFQQQKWKLDILYKVTFVVNFRQSVISVELSQPEDARCFFLEKTTPYSTILQILFGKFSSSHQLTCCVQIL